MKVIRLKSDKETQKPVSQEMQIISKKHLGESYLDNIFKQVQEGNVPATFVTFQIKKFEKQIQILKQKIEDQSMTELVGNGDYQIGEEKLIVRQGSRTFDYSKCEGVQKAQELLKQEKDKYKSAYEGIEKGNTVLTEDNMFVDQDGVTQNFPTPKYSKDSIVLTKVGRG